MAYPLDSVFSPVHSKRIRLVTRSRRVKANHGQPLGPESPHEAMNQGAMDQAAMDTDAPLPAKSTLRLQTHAMPQTQFRCLSEFRLKRRHPLPLRPPRSVSAHDKSIGKKFWPPSLPTHDYAHPHASRAFSNGRNHHLRRPLPSRIWKRLRQPFEENRERLATLKLYRRSIRLAASVDGLIARRCDCFGQHPSAHGFQLGNPKRCDAASRLDAICRKQPRPGACCEAAECQVPNAFVNGLNSPNR